MSVQYPPFDSRRSLFGSFASVEARFGVELHPEVDRV